MYLDNEAFLSALNKLYQTTSKKGSVWVTMKKYVDSDSNFSLKKPDRVKSDEEENKCLVRATNGKKKISTIVLAKDKAMFEKSYKNVLLINLDNLKVEKKKPTNASTAAKSAAKKSKV
ncbi:hypothetical protein RB653_010493 [Dictyostelium firmibasis]|uniref:Signal recognition particle 14 kDa protein n=1 Tax=Dictyostelium firmibasis TaxID=79012 RepID=A0AAN7TK52_9MYCE